MDIVVRPLTEDDLPAYIEMAAAFHADCPVNDLIPFDPEGTADFLTGIMSNENVRAVLAELDGVPVGIAGAALYPMYFSPDSHVVQELWWWLSPSHRGSGAAQRMYKDIENWAKDSGAVALFMIALHNDNVDRMAKMYGRSGFRPMERTFVKGLL
jgi:RimJ/RimL family protein N-acetyltransferase